MISDIDKNFFPISMKNIDDIDENLPMKIFLISMKNCDEIVANRETKIFLILMTILMILAQLLVIKKKLAEIQLMMQKLAK